MQVKIIKSISLDSLEREINAFIKGKTIQDIKLSIDDISEKYIAMIICNKIL